PDRPRLPFRAPFISPIAVQHIIPSADEARQTGTIREGRRFGPVPHYSAFNVIAVAPDTLAFPSVDIKSHLMRPQAINQQWPITNNVASFSPEMAQGSVPDRPRLPKLQRRGFAFNAICLAVDAYIQIPYSPRLFMAPRFNQPFFDTAQA